MARCSRFHSLSLLVLLAVFGAAFPHAQGLGGVGTVQGVVKDPTGGVMQAVIVTLNNPVSGFKRDATTDADGKYVFSNLPPNPYHVTVAAQGFQTLERDVNVRTAVPITVDLTLALGGTTTSVEVVGHVEDLLERDPTAHTDIDQSLMARLPLESSSGLNQVVTLASPGVIADSNGFFHPIGDHAQTQFSIDNQPVTDQQSRVYSNQISPDAVGSMEVITGVAPAEYGDKSSLVVHIVTKSGLDQTKPFGSVSFGYGSFKSPTVDANVGGGSRSFGNFLSVTGMRTDRYLDPPEFTALHDTGNSVAFFDRLDAKPGDMDTFHLNIQAARSSFDVPNTFDQDDAGQDQHQEIKSFNIAPGYSRVIGLKTLFTANAFVRRDDVTYLPSADPFSDTPATVSQSRQLRNIGAKVDVAYAAGNQNVKAGGTFSATRLNEKFSIGITDPALNSPCFDRNGDPSEDAALRALSQCRAPALVPNPDFDPGLLGFDLSRRGRQFAFSDEATIKGQAAYIQDDIRAGNATVKLGVRIDHYSGVTTDTLVQPRLGVSYAVPASQTVLRASYGRTMETPYNENLLLSSGAGAEALAGEATPLAPGRRHQSEFGIQQSLGRWIVVDVGYYDKRTDNAYDFGVLFDTPISFPISWDHSKINGFTGRINLVEHGGFRAFMVAGHARAIFSGPGNGGLFVEPASGDFAIDHDQKFQQTTNLQQVFHEGTGTWAALSWRYDSGLVAGAVGSIADALALSADQQAAIGFFCGSTVATPDSRITSCGSGGGTTRLTIPAEGTEDDVDNPPRIAQRHLLNLGMGVDNLFRGDRAKVRVRFSVLNLTNEKALYNFLSTFSGTHFVTPRAYQVQLGVTF